MTPRVRWLLGLILAVGFLLRLTYSLPFVPVLLRRNHDGQVVKDDVSTVTGFCHVPYS